MRALQPYPLGEYADARSLLVLDYDRLIDDFRGELRKILEGWEKDSNTSKYL